MTDQNEYPEHWLNREAIRALRWIILSSIGGIIVLSLWGIALRFGVIGDGSEQNADSADEALSILGNVGSAAVGGLVGWLTRTVYEPIHRAHLESGQATEPPADESEGEWS